MTLKLKLKVPDGASKGRTEETKDRKTSNIESLKAKIPSGRVKKETKKEKVETSQSKLKLNLTKDKESNKSGGINDIPVPKSSVPKVRIKPARIPGEGYDSEAPDLEDDPLIEHGIAIKFLNDENLDFVHNAVDSGDLSGVNIKWLTKDKAVVSINGTLYLSRLVDLPTITELYKTIDKKNIFKTIDLCQILLVIGKVNPSELSLERDFEIPEEYQFRHPIYSISPKGDLKPRNIVSRNGLSYPLTDPFRRFKPRRLNHRVVDDIEAAVDDMVRLDEKAEKSHFQLIDLKKQSSGGRKYDNASGTHSERTTPSPAPPQVRTPLYNEQVEDIHQIRQDDAKLEEVDLEDELAKALENEDNLNSDLLLNENNNMLVETTGDIHGKQVAEVEAQIEEPDEEDDEEDDDDEEEDDDEDINDYQDNDQPNESKHLVKKLEEEIADLESAVEVHRKGLASATHKMMKMKFQTGYNTLKASLDSKKREIAKIMNEQANTGNKPSEGNDGTEKASRNQNYEHSNELGSGDYEDDDNDEDIDDLF